MRPLAAACALAVALLAAPAPAAAATGKAPRARLTTFDSCAQLTRFARANATEARTAAAPAGPGRPVAALAPASPVLRGDREAQGPPPEAAPAAAQAAPSAPAPADTSTTNVQEAGVDEPDVAKLQGGHLYALTGGVLRVVDVRPAAPVLVGSLEVAAGTYGGELLVHRDTVLVLTQTQTGTRLTQVDVRDRAAPRVVRVQDADGAYVTARLTGSTARVVTAHRPSVLSPAARRPIARTGAKDWLPRVRFADRRSGRRFFRSAAPCDDVARPVGPFAGLDATTVLTVDLERGLPAVDSDVLMAAAHTVYASPGALYVATQAAVPAPAAVAPGEEVPAPPPLTTAVHRFDTARPGVTEYRSSGTVRGTLLNQFSLSEHRGVLRAATTEWPLWWNGGPAGATESESAVTTLTERDGRLVQTGRVGGLGRGERIYAVRFIDDVGYVVTFRQTDPLYTLDLADPARPRVLGELKILGYSAYLHPVGEDLLLGVGQDATEQGMQTGAQVSLFDVSDLRRPVRLHQAPLGARGARAGVEDDHRAFLHWPAARLVVLPMRDWSGGGEPFTGAVGLRVGRAEGLREAGRADHATDAYRGEVQRAFVAGGGRLTVSG